MIGGNSGMGVRRVLRARAKLTLTALVSLALTVGCAREIPNEATGGTAKQAQTFERTLSFTLPPLTASQSVALGATKSLIVRDRSEVRVPSGGYATIANLAAGGASSVGVNAKVGNVWSVPSIALRPGSTVTGFVKTSGVADPKIDATVTGGITENLPITPELRTRKVVFPNATQDVELEPNQTRVLSPGSYLKLNVKTNAKLTLSTGTYYFESLKFEPSSEIRLNKASGPIYVYVLNTFIHRGTFVDGGGKLANALFGYFGTSLATIEAPFLGTLVAPSAKIWLSTIGSSPGHRGAFFGKEIELAPDTTVWLHPFGVTVDPTWNVPTPDGNAEAFLDMAIRSDGGALATTTKRVMRVQPNGTATTVFSGTPNADVFFLNGAGTGFGVNHGADVNLYRADGSSVRSYTRTGYEYSTLVPGVDTAFFPEVTTTHERPTITHARFFGASGTQLARFATPGLEVSRLTATDLYYSTGTKLFRMSQTGTQVWHVNAALMSFEVSQGTRLIAELRDERSVQHFVNGVAQPVVALGSPVYRIAIAPGGAYSAAAIKQGVQLFQNGSPTVAINLPVNGITSLAVSNRGETLIGAVSDGDARRALLLDAQGEVLWDSALTADTQAFRPELSFLPGDNAFLTREATRVSAFNINRTL
jgi:hypothetical protein